MKAAASNQGRVTTRAVGFHYGHVAALRRYLTRVDDFAGW
jgi:hypothetical protein